MSIIKITKRGNVKIDGVKYVATPLGPDDCACRGCACRGCAFSGRGMEACRQVPCCDFERGEPGFKHYGKDVFFVKPEEQA